MLSISKYKWSLVVFVIQIALTLMIWSQLPVDAKVPSHWNSQNEIDGFMSRDGALGFSLGINAIAFLFFYLMPLYSPWYRKYEARFERILPSLCFILMLFFALINLYAFYLAKTGDYHPAFQMIYVLIGLLLITLGNIMPKVPKNFFIGIKTPWTLSSDDIWQKTHRLGGWLFVLGGLVMIVKAFIPSIHAGLHNVLTVFACVMMLYPLLHSLFLFNKQNKESK